ncbi:MAG: 2-oxoglutarate synthase [Candidatus Cloacimonetes bacterium HGW-Cloacimonetes-2]|nr:MAG: 2-oxoglutarate synthase [Candidatus Cloacimonetes bacterium HGW-Cloacimonetes-2]
MEELGILWCLQQRSRRLSMRNLDTPKANTWCPACGNFGILNAVKAGFKQLFDQGLDPAKLMITCGIGCHGKIFDYLNISGIYGLHGRAVATASGIKLANPELTVVSFGGDGDSLGEGLEHTLFAAKRNLDMTLILHNNGNYGLTTGQFSPLSPIGFRGLSTPQGSAEQPFDAIPLLLAAGASFVARSYSANPKHLAEILVKAVMHRGFSFIEVLQPCVSYNNTYQYYNSRIKMLDQIPSDVYEAMRLAKDKDHSYLGIYQAEKRDLFEDLSSGFANPVKESPAFRERIETLRTMYK